MTELSRVSLRALTYCINLFIAFRNVFCFKVSQADSASSMELTSDIHPDSPMESTSQVDPTPITPESTSNVDPTPIDSRMAVEEGQWSDLPHELLSKIASGLGLMDFLSFRCVCKDWHMASSKVSHEDKYSEPWFLIYQGEEGSKCSLLNNEHKRYVSYILELDGATCLASYEGWLLLFRPDSLFFFCPFSKAKIELPNCPFTEVTEHIAAFSSAPTTQDCTVVVLNRQSIFELQLFMLCRGEKVWTKYSYFGCNFNRMRTAVFYEEKEFHFMDGWNGMISFNASKTPQWTTDIMYPNQDLSEEVLVLDNTIRENLFQRHNDNGFLTFLEANDSLSTCGTTISNYTRQFDMTIGGESIQAPNNQSESRHFKAVWIQPKYCYVPPGQTW